MMELLRNLWPGILALVCTGAAASQASAITQLTSGPYSVVEYEWSPSGDAIAFIWQAADGTTELCRVAATGGAVTVLSAPGADCSSPEWSANGAYLLTSMQVAGQRRVCALNPGTGSIMYQSTNASRFSPSFGPTRVVSTVVAAAADSDSLQHLVRLNLVTGLEVPLNSPGEGSYGPEYRSSFRGVLHNSQSGDGVYQIFETPIFGGPSSQLTDLSYNIVEQDTHPNGNIVFVAGALEESGVNQLYRVVGDAAPIQMTSGGIRYAAPRWSPDGHTILFERTDVSGNRNLFKVAMEGGVQTQLTTGSQLKRDGRFSPNESMLAYIQQDQVDATTFIWNLYVKPMATGDVVQTGPIVPSARIERAFPNPSTGELTVRVSLASSGSARLEWIGADGRQRWTREIASPEAGSRELTITAKEAGGAGVYFLRLVQDGRGAARKVIIR